MAKENIVLLHGKIHNMPKVYANNDGTLVKAMFALQVLRRPVRGGKFLSNKLYFDMPVVLIRDPEQIKQVCDFMQNDMVDIRGVLSTKECVKTTICPQCGQKNSIKGTTTYVTPIYICKREPAVSDEEALRLLKERCEVSNMAMVIGTLCRDPEIYTDEKNKSFAQYQLAVNRRYRIKEDSAETKTDYPWVKTVGEQALKDAYALKTGSQVYINGALQTREITRGTKCEYCEASYEWNDNATEIIPYSTEYLSNCIVPEKEEGETNAES